MNTEIILIAITLIFSVALYIIKFRMHKNILYFGKIVSRAILTTTFIMEIHKGLFRFEYVLPSLLAVIVSDVLYDVVTSYKAVVQKKITEQVYIKYYRLLDNIDVPVLVADQKSLEIIYKNKAFVAQYGCEKGDYVYNIIKDFEPIEGRFQKIVCGKLKEITCFKTTNSINTITIIIH